MATEKKFYRVRLAEHCAAPQKMVNGVTLTKQWQMKVGEIGAFAKFPDVEAQVMVKQGNGFVPAQEASGEAGEGADGSQEGTASTTPTAGAQAAPAGNPAQGSEEAPDFNNWTVEQLKTWLIAKGVAQNELRNATKPGLIERAEFIWSQN